MTIAYKTKPNVNGNVQRVVVHHDKKTYSFDDYWAHIDLIVKSRELKELVAILNLQGYTKA